MKGLEASNIQHDQTGIRNTGCRFQVLEIGSCKLQVGFSWHGYTFATSCCIGFAWKLSHQGDTICLYSWCLAH